MICSYAAGCGQIGRGAANTQADRSFAAYRKRGGSNGKNNPEH
jgi:hypothetical protein